MDAISLLRADHRKVDALFERFERTTDRAVKLRREIVDEIIEELAKHAMVEEQFLYPALRERVPDEEDMVLQALEEHHVAKWLLLELHKLDAGAERFAAKVTVLTENIRHHVKEEERELFKLMKAAFTREELEDLGAMMEDAKAFAPTRPHPRAPDTPPGNLVAGTLSAILDRGMDLMGELRAPRELAAKVVRAGRRSKKRR